MSRAWLERAAHAVALALVIYLLVDSLRPPYAGEEVAGHQSLPAALARWSTVDVPTRVHVRVDSGLSPVQLDWLSALRGAGTRVSWAGDGLLPWSDHAPVVVEL